VKIESIELAELGENELAVWRGLIDADAGFGSPFLTPTYCRIVATHRPRNRVALLHDGPDLVGFLPYGRDHEQVGLPIGAPMNDAQALIASRQLELDLPELVRDLGARVWRFDHLLPGQEAFADFVESWHSSPTIDLARGVDAYHESVREHSHGLLKKTGKKRRQLGREVGPVTFEWHSSDAALLDTLIEWKSRQYQRTHVHDLFASSWPRAALHEFHESNAAECAGVLSVVRAGDRLVALNFAIRRGPVLHSWFGAYDPALAKYSPGLVLLLDRAAAGPAHGVALIDLGRGDQDFKRRVANGEYLVGDGRVPARGRTYRAVLLAKHPGWLARRVRSFI
jgi:CelD/BcsL family acetyltransferase involved in cellulose biosynthesis